MKFILIGISIIGTVLAGEQSFAADVQLPGVDINLTGQGDGNEKFSTAIKLFLAMTVLSLAPSLVVMMTSFTRIIVVLSMLRQALGMQQTPPNSVLISLALFLTVFSMYPTINAIQDEAYTPYVENKIDEKQALEQFLTPIKKFMVKQTREADLLLMLELSNEKKPTSIEDISTVSLIPAFMISELKTAFQIGFMIFLPFLLIDIIVAGVLMSMGMLMVPPMMISLPIKILMFVLIDGWRIVLNSLVGSIM